VSCSFYFFTKGICQCPYGNGVPFGFILYIVPPSGWHIECIPGMNNSFISIQKFQGRVFLMAACFQVCNAMEVVRQLIHQIRLIVWKEPYPLCSLKLRNEYMRHIDVEMVTGCRTFAAEEHIRKPLQDFATGHIIIHNILFQLEPDLN